ncbi:hypothetical protein AVEN_40663-1 [Araneus ventricosus]|uniref:Sushi domain-containing protein n=1 Tax=Araneus ventricosus TaxID=182803 RepID=A0A4Y2VMZ1_ARAVE|nr:hypothetical protein AVEN_40663-1 [Araneus ventricosus]
MAFLSTACKNSHHYFSLVSTLPTKVTKGGVRPPGHQLYLTCESRHVFQGSEIINVTTTCKEGKWQPEPVCLSSKYILSFTPLLSCFFFCQLNLLAENREDN